MIEGIVEQHRVPGRTESCKRLLEMCAEQELVVGNSWLLLEMCAEQELVVGNSWLLLEMCAEQELVVGNSWFHKNDVYKSTWFRMAEGRVVDRALMDDVFSSKRRLRRLLDVKVWRGEGGGMSEDFLVEARLKLMGGWRSAGRMGGVRM